MYVPDDPNSNKLLDEIEASIGDFNARPSIGRALAYKGYDASEIVRSAYVPTASEDEALNKIREQQTKPAPALKIAKDGLLPGFIPDHPDEMTGIILLMEALGTTDPHFVRGLVGQVTHATAKGGKVDADSVNFILSVIKGYKPRDQFESMLAAQMAAVHMAIMKAFRQLVPRHSDYDSLDVTG